MLQLVQGRFGTNRHVVNDSQASVTQMTCQPRIHALALPNFQLTLIEMRCASRSEQGSDGIHVLSEGPHCGAPACCLAVPALQEERQHAAKRQHEHATQVIADASNAAARYCMAETDSPI